MKVHLRNPKRAIKVVGPMKVHALLEHLEINPESVLVIRGDALASKEEQLHDDDEIEVRPVISGGSGPLTSDALQTEIEPPGRPA